VTDRCGRRCMARPPRCRTRGIARPVWWYAACVPSRMRRPQRRHGDKEVGMRRFRRAAVGFLCGLVLLGTGVMAAPSGSEMGGGKIQDQRQHGLGRRAGQPARNRASEGAGDRRPPDQGAVHACGGSPQGEGHRPEALRCDPRADHRRRRSCAVGPRRLSRGVRPDRGAGRLHGRAVRPPRPGRARPASAAVWPRAEARDRRGRARPSPRPSGPHAAARTDRDGHGP